MPFSTEYIDINTHFPRPKGLTFYFFFITHMFKERSPSVQDSFILHPIVIEKKKRMLRLLLKWATWSSPASGQVNLQAVVHACRAESLFLWWLSLLHAALLIWCLRMCWPHIASVLTLRGQPHGQAIENNPNLVGWMLRESVPLGSCRREKQRWKQKKKKLPREEDGCFWSVRDDRLWKSSFSA